MVLVGGRAEEAGDAVYSNGTRKMNERKRLILSCLLAYRRARLRYFITICSINIHQYDSSYFPVHHIPSRLAIGRTYVHRASHWSNTSDTDCWNIHLALLWCHSHYLLLLLASNLIIPLHLRHYWRYLLAFPSFFFYCYCYCSLDLFVSLPNCR